MKVQFWQVSGYEASGDIIDEPEPGTRLHAGANIWASSTSRSDAGKRSTRRCRAEEYPTVGHTAS